MVFSNLNDNIKDIKNILLIYLYFKLSVHKPQICLNNRWSCCTGADLKEGREGGTWLGASTRGKVGCLLNIRTPSGPDASKKGRGRVTLTQFIHWMVHSTFTILNVSNLHNYHLLVLLLTAVSENDVRPQ